MRFIAIAIVLLILAAAFYITDRKTIQQNNVHAADSLDSLSSAYLHRSFDSMIRANNRFYNARLNQLRLRLEFQNSMIFKLSQEIDTLKAERKPIFRSSNGR